MSKKVWLLVLMIFCVCLCACSSSNGQKENVSSIPQSQDTLLLTPDFSYEITPQIPHIRVDEIGYMPESKKTVFVLGKNLEEKFLVMNDKTKEVVYEGKLSRTKSTEEEKNVYTGDFSDLAVEGSYKIYQPDVGYSYSFSIGKNVYADLVKELESKITSNHYRQVDSLTFILGNLLLRKELYGSKTEDDISDPDEDWIKEQISYLLESQDEKTGAYSTIYKDRAKDKEISLSATAQISGVLAQYAYVYGDQDVDIKNKCIWAAKRAYNYIHPYRDNISEDMWYYSAAQLYRVTGEYTYRRAIEEYDQVTSTSSTVSSHEFTMLADVAYLSTTFRTDLNRCNTIMNTYVKRAQEMSLVASKDSFYVYPDADIRQEDDLLEDMMVLGIVSYVLSGREYAGLQENYIHYFLGVNQDANNKIEAVSDDTSEIVKTSQLLFILGRLSY